MTDDLEGYEVKPLAQDIENAKQQRKRKRRRCKATWPLPSSASKPDRRCNRLADPGKHYCKRCRQAKKDARKH